MSAFRLTAAVLAARRRPAVGADAQAAGLRSGSRRSRTRTAPKINKMASDRSKLNGAVLDYQSDGEGAIHIAVAQGQCACTCASCSRSGANPDLIADERGETPLTLAVMADQPDMRRSLLARNAREVDQANRAGETPLIKAVSCHRPQIVRLLLAKGADPDQADYRRQVGARSMPRPIRVRRRSPSCWPTRPSAARRRSRARDPLARARTVRPPHRDRSPDQPPRPPAARTPACSACGHAPAAAPSTASRTIAAS